MAGQGFERASTIVSRGDSGSVGLADAAAELGPTYVSPAFGPPVEDVGSIESPPSGPAPARLGPPGLAGPILEDVDPAQLRAVQEGLDPSLILRAVRLPDGTIIDFVCEDANDAAGDSLDLVKELLVGAFMTETIGEDLASFLLERCSDAVETGKSLSFDDLRIPDVDSDEDRHYDIRAVAVGDRVCFSWREVTEGFRSAQSLTESRNRYRLLAENSSDVVIMMAPDGVVEWVSPSVRDMLGWDAQEFVGRPISEFVFAEDLDRQAAIHRHPAMVRAPVEELRYRCAGGGHLWVSARTREVLDDEGRTVNIVASLRDVDKQVLARRALVASEERFRVLAENVTDVVYEAVDGRFVWVSPSVERVLGWDPSELIGKPSFSIIAPEDLPRAEQARKQVLGDTPLERFECRFLTASGERRWMLAHARQVEISGNTTTSLVAGLSDIHLEMINRLALSVLASVNSVMVGSTDESSLVSDVCRTIGESDDFAAARYSRSGGESGEALVSVASAPEDDGALRPEATCWYVGPFADDVTFGALDSGMVQVRHRTGVERTVPPWTGGSDGFWHRSSIGLPVLVDGVVDGVLTIESDSVNAFSSTVADTLEQLAHQMGSALARVRIRDRLLASLNEQLVLGAAIEQSGESVVVTDLDSVIVYANPATSITSGYTNDELVGASMSLFASGLHGPGFFEDISEQLQTGRTWRGVMVNRNKLGELYEEDTSITSVRSGDGEINGHVFVLRNITRERKLESDLDRLRSDRQSVIRALSGVRVGATVEATAASFCSAITRLEDVDLARVLLVETDDRVVPLGITGQSYLDWEVGVPVTFASLGTMLEMTEAGPWWLPLHDVAQSGDTYASVVGPMVDAGFESIGFAPIWWEDRMSGILVVASRTPEAEQWVQARDAVIEELSSFARTVLGAQAHRCSEQGKLRDEIRAMIADVAHRPVYQPVIDLHTGEVKGYEALTRFTNGRRPDLVFEEAHVVGLGIELETACAVNAARGAADLPAGGWLAVNFSPASVIADSLAAVVKLTNRPVVVEITEHVEIKNYSVVRDAVARTPGVRISVDDAGAGYASLHHILELQPDFVKLDIGLVRNIDSDPARQALSAGLRYYSEQAGNTLIAEGIETAGEHETLDHLGISLGQGYLFGRPAPAVPTP